MHDIKIIRNDPQVFAKKLSDRNIEIDLKKLLDLDAENRKLIQKKEKLEQEKKIISKKKDKTQFNRSKDISLEIQNLSKNQIIIKNNIDILISSLPNLAQPDVPIGKDATSNKEIKKYGKINKFEFEPLSHGDLGKRLNQMDFDVASKTSGARFVFLKNQLALLERAISNFMLDIHSQEFGYQEISPPLIVNESTMFGTGQLPKFESDQFELKLNDEKFKKFLIPTAEVVLTNIVRESILEKSDLHSRSTC